MKLALLLFLFLIFCQHEGFAQENCNTAGYHNGLINTSSELHRMNGAIDLPDSVRSARLNSLVGTIVIPVKVHVVYHTTRQKIGEEVIRRQIDQLNMDFGGQSPDTALVPNCFKPLIANCGLYFTLAGIDYRKTDVGDFDCSNYKTQIPENDKIKFHSMGGIDGSASTQYLNVWIGNINNGENTPTLFGYATYPYGIGTYDGVVINYKAVGPGGLFTDYGGGRTLTHEVGHWLNLRHIWGDSECGDDTIDDTPTQQSFNNAIPIFPKKSCGNTENGEMYMNFMDYTYDTGREMFTIDQSKRMREQFIEGGFRASFVQNRAINFLSVLDTSIRGDSTTPVLTNIADRKKDVPIQIGSKIVTWTKVKEATNFIVFVRELGQSKVDTVRARENFATVAKLAKGKIYEVTIKAVNAEGNLSSESVPYLFKYLDDPKRKVLVR